MINYVKYECLGIEVADKIKTATLSRPQGRAMRSIRSLSANVARSGTIWPTIGRLVAWC